MSSAKVNISFGSSGGGMIENSAFPASCKLGLGLYFASQILLSEPLSLPDPVSAKSKIETLDLESPLD